MKPRIELPADALTDRGTPDGSQIVPELAAARQQLRRVAFRMKTVDPVTTELVRMRNARFQNCVF
jgi:hypothetical protein